MIVPSGAVRVLVATRPVDFRKGMDGLAALVQERMRLTSSQLSACGASDTSGIEQWKTGFRRKRDARDLLR